MKKLESLIRFGQGKLAELFLLLLALIEIRNWKLVLICLGYWLLWFLVKKITSPIFAMEEHEKLIGFYLLTAFVFVFVSALAGMYNFATNVPSEIANFVLWSSDCYALWLLFLASRGES